LKISVETFSPSETADLGAHLAGYVKPGDIIGLTGDLGAGKTKFVQGIAEGLKITDPVTSPTFAIIKEYTGGRIPLYHFDAYRLQGEKDLIDLGYEDYFFGDGVCAVEWGNIVEGLFPEDALMIKIEREENESRRFTISFKDIRWHGAAEALLR
jgi:tRNA threonylcarbamoyladenosine biosynthesis protein TsaE